MILDTEALRHRLQKISEASDALADACDELTKIEQRLLAMHWRGSTPSALAQAMKDVKAATQSLEAEIIEHEDS